MLVRFFKYIIKLYWKFIPVDKRIVCLFEESCSKNIYRNLSQKGLVFGLNSFIYRFKNCRRGYTLFEDGNKVFLKTKTGIVISEEKVNKIILMSFDK